MVLDIVLNCVTIEFIVQNKEKQMNDWKDFSNMPTIKSIKDAQPKMGFSIPPGSKYNFNKASRRNSSAGAVAGVSAMVALLVVVLVVISYYVHWGALLLINWLIGFFGWALPFDINWKTALAFFCLMIVLRLLFGGSSSSSNK